MDISEYLKLIETFVTKQISASQFEVEYLKLFKNEKRMPPEEIYVVLNGIFVDVDEVCSNPNLRGKDDLNKQQLLEHVTKAYNKLKTIPQITRG